MERLFAYPYADSSAFVRRQIGELLRRVRGESQTIEHRLEPWHLGEDVSCRRGMRLPLAMRRDAKARVRAVQSCANEMAGKISSRLSRELVVHTHAPVPCERTRCRRAGDAVHLRRGLPPLFSKSE